MADNIILIVADDHGSWALGAAGNEDIRTPNLDTLAKTGVMMENAFTPTPVCSPARACLLTGRLASQHGVHDYLSSRDPAIHERAWLAQETTLAQSLQEAGYETALVGKWHLGADEQPQPGFDRWFALSGDYPSGHGGANRYSDQGEMRTIEGYKTTVLTEEAIAFLRRRDGERPFFLYLNYVGTHSPWTGHPPRLVSGYAKQPLSLPAGPDYPFGRRNLEATLPTRHRPHEALAQYYAAVSHIDEGVGHLLDELEALGLREQTLLAYTSDHGLNCGHHGIWGKGNGTLPLNMLEESIRVPLLFNQPDRIFGRQRRAEFVDHLDLYQTLLAYAGVQPPREPESYPGISYLHLLENRGPASLWTEGAQKRRHDRQFGEYGNLRMVRTPRYKLVRRYPDGPDELFDLRTDPGETVNRFGDEKLSNVLAALRAEIGAYFARYEDEAHSGLRVRELPRHNDTEAWRAGGRSGGLNL